MATSHEWIIVGGGIAGVALAEILTREGHEVLLLEQHGQIAAETSSDLHEWIHTGCLYTLLPDKLITMKYLLGAIDDLLEYYACFPRMNAVPTEQGLSITAQGWFEPNYVHFRYRNRRFNPLWTLVAARSQFLIGRLAEHDWLRRRAGIFDEFNDGYWTGISTRCLSLLRSQSRCSEVQSTDFTADTRMLLTDLLAAALERGLELKLDKKVREIRNLGKDKLVVTSDGSYRARHVALCAGRTIADFTGVKVTTSYAPMAVVEGLPPEVCSFVELDIRVSNCINLLTKGNGLGLAGGISLKRESECDTYLDSVVRRHAAYQPSLMELGRYIGVKNEIVFPKQNRNYMFHIVPCGENLWATVPGKFTLGFSLAPEFYRRAYKRNPRKYFRPGGDTQRAASLVAPVRWRAIADGADKSIEMASREDQKAARPLQRKT